MKPKSTKRKEAIQRLSSSQWGSAKSNRLKTKTEQQWLAWKVAELKHLEEAA